MKIFMGALLGKFITAATVIVTAVILVPLAVVSTYQLGQYIGNSIVKFAQKNKQEDIREKKSGIKKQGKEIKNKSRKSKGWKNNSGKRRPTIPKKHTPSKKTRNT